MRDSVRYMPIDLECDSASLSSQVRYIRRVMALRIVGKLELRRMLIPPPMISSHVLANYGLQNPIYVLYWVVVRNV